MRQLRRKSRRATPAAAVADAIGAVFFRSNGGICQEQAVRDDPANNRLRVGCRRPRSRIALADCGSLEVHSQAGQFGHRRVTMHTTENVSATTARQGWNAGRMVGAKRALKPRQIWEIRFYLNQNGRVRDRALFDFAIDSKLRGCDVVGLKIGDLVSGGHARSGDIHQPRNRTSRAAGRLLRCRYFVHCVIQPPTVSCHWTEFLGFSTQWFSSPK